VIAYLRALFSDARPFMTHAEARTRMAKLLEGSTPPRVLWSLAYPMPTREEAREILAEAENVAEMRQFILEDDNVIRFQRSAK
jgi:hypothetical protein